MHWNTEESFEDASLSYKKNSYGLQKFSLKSWKRSPTKRTDAEQNVGGKMLDPYKQIH